MMLALRTAATCIACTLLAGTCTYTQAQTPAAETASADEHKSSIDYTRQMQGDFVVKTYRLVNMTQQNDANEVVIALRNILSPSIHIYMDFSANTIVIAAPPDQQQIAQNLVANLDILKPTYRITYTLTEIEDGKRIGTQHYTLAATDGQHVTLKQGSKIPLVTNTSGKDTSFQYIDVGVNFSVEADAAGNGVLLKSKVEQSSVPEEKAISNIQEPVIRQAVLEGATLIQLNKPFILGSIDVVGSTRRIDVEVVAETVNQRATTR